MTTWPDSLKNIFPSTYNLPGNVDIFRQFSNKQWTTCHAILYPDSNHLWNKMFFDFYFYVKITHSWSLVRIREHLTYCWILSFLCFLKFFAFLWFLLFSVFSSSSEVTNQSGDYCMVNAKKVVSISIFFFVLFFCFIPSSENFCFLYIFSNFRNLK